MSRATLAALLAAWACVLAPPAQAAPPRPVYTISIGHNEIPDRLRTPANEGLVALRYADDDAAAFHLFMRGLSRRAYLLSILDADTQQRLPDLARTTRLPTRADLAAVVGEVKAAMAQDRAAGLEPVLVFFYSGHGIRDESGAPGLALHDGVLDQAWLYDQVLASLPARFAHLIVDACHAEAIVRPRDAEGQIEPIGQQEREAYLEASSLARFPHVGALLASTAGAQSFEWDAYRGGVFAHEVLSGLRGAADVNGDGQVEYSELAAFVAAANLEIADRRVRPQVVVLPPRADRRAPIVELASAPGTFRVAGWARGPWAQPFHVETDGGARLLDAFPERDAPIAYSLPANELLYFVGPAGELVIRPSPGEVVDIGALRFGPPRARPRGALESSMRRGLFATAFGPSFYRGYVSQRAELVPVAFADARQLDVQRAPPAVVAAPTLPPRTAPSPAGTGALPTALFVGATLTTLTSGVLALWAWDARTRYERTSIERDATRALSDFERYRALSVTAGVVSVALIGTGLAVVYWPRSPGRSASHRTRVAFTGSGLVLAGSFP